MNILALFLKLLGIEYGFSMRAFLLAIFLITVGTILRNRNNSKVYGKILMIIGIFLLCLNILVVFMIYLLNTGFG